MIFLAFGGYGLHGYLSRCALELFRASVLFPIVIATLVPGITMDSLMTADTTARQRAAHCDSGGAGARR